jgi:hypothetical protein
LNLVRCVGKGLLKECNDLAFESLRQNLLRKLVHFKSLNRIFKENLGRDEFVERLKSIHEVLIKTQPLIGPWYQEALRILDHLNSTTVSNSAKACLLHRFHSHYEDGKLHFAALNKLQKSSMEYEWHTLVNIANKIASDERVWMHTEDESLFATIVRESVKGSSLLGKLL